MQRILPVPLPEKNNVIEVRRAAISVGRGIVDDIVSRYQI